MSTKLAIYTAHPTLDSFAAARLRGEPVWKSIANNVATHKRYIKRKGITVTDADAYLHLRHIALKRKHTRGPTTITTLSPLVRPVAASTTQPPSIAASHLAVIVPAGSAAAPPTGTTTDDGTRSPLTPPSSPSPSNKILNKPATPRTPSTPATPAHNPCCVCRSKPAATLILPCRDQRLCAECWVAYLAAEKEVHGRKEKLRKKLFYGTFVTAPFVPVCPTCRQVVVSSFVPFTN